MVNLEGARLLFRRVLDNLAALRSPLFGAGVIGRWGFLFLNQFGCVSPEIGLTFCYELDRQRRIEDKIDLSSSGTGPSPSIDHKAYSTLTEFILLKRKKLLLMLHFFGLEVPECCLWISNKGKPPYVMPFD